MHLPCNATCVLRGRGRRGGYSASAHVFVHTTRHAVPCRTNKATKSLGFILRPTCALFRPPPRPARLVHAPPLSTCASLLQKHNMVLRLIWTHPSAFPISLLSVPNAPTCASLLDRQKMVCSSLASWSSTPLPYLSSYLQNTSFPSPRTHPPVHPCLTGRRWSAAPWPPGPGPQ